jgi:hypothetical protein
VIRPEIVFEASPARLSDRVHHAVGTYRDNPVIHAVRQAPC